MKVIRLLCGASQKLLVLLISVSMALSPATQGQIDPRSWMLMACLIAAVVSGLAGVALLRNAGADPRNRVPLMRALCLALPLALGCLPVYGQGPVDPSDPNFSTGKTRLGSFAGGHIDTINLLTGGNNIDIPLMSYPQRGKLKLDFVLHYLSTQWYADQVPGSAYPTTYTGPIVLQQGFNTIWAGVPGEIWPGVPGATLPNGSGSGLPPVLSGPTCPNVTIVSNVSTTTMDCIGEIEISDGSMLSLWASGPTTYLAVDGSGYRLDSPPLGGVGLVMTDSNGTRYSVVNGGYTVEDTNGNKITTSFNSSNNTWSLTDTVGRVVPPPVNTADFTGCTGPLAISSAFTWSIPGINGGTYFLKFCYVLVSETLPVQVIARSVGNLPQTYNATLLQSVVLPDTTAWTFQYTGDGFGDLAKISFPTGGTVSYTWTTPAPIDPSSHGIIVTRAVQTRVLDPNDGINPVGTTLYNYTRNISNTGGQPTTTTVVTDASGNDTVHNFTGLQSYSYYETSSQSYQGSSTSGTLIKSIKTDYTFNPAYIDSLTNTTYPIQNVVPLRVTTTLASGLQSKIEYDYDSAPTVFLARYTSTNSGPLTYSGPIDSHSGTYGRTIAKREFDYGNGAPGPLIRTTSTIYQALANAPYLNNNLLDLPSSVSITNAAGTEVANTSYGYDESTLASSGISTQHDTAPPAGTARGNETSVGRWLNTTNSTMKNVSTWYDTGQPFQQTDPLGNSITQTYDAAYAGAYRTMTCNPLSQCDSATYDFNTGLMTSFTNVNASNQASGNNSGDSAHTTSYRYDSLLRLITATAPQDPSNGNTSSVTSFTYSAPNTPPVSVQRQSSITPAITDQLTTYLDGLARVNQTRHAAPGCMEVVDKIYDSLGRVASVSNPYCLGSNHSNDPTYGVTLTQYDAIGRVVKVTRQDSSIVSTQYDQTSPNSANGNCATTTDEAGKMRKSCLDGLGRLIEVDEPQASGGGMSSPYVTLYQYDALDNMLSVTQKGGTTDQTQWRVRSFTYDSLSRLLTETNPESGTVTYTYDANGNVLQKTSPAPNQTGSATQTVSYCYDGVSRITGKAYSAQNCTNGLLPNGTAAVKYTYDEGGQAANALGRLTTLTDLAGNASYKYDLFGRLSGESRIINGVTKNLSYEYNLDASIKVLHYPSGGAVTYSPDSAGRTLSALDNGNSISYVTGATYGPDGLLTGFTSGQSVSFGITNTFSYNPRLQPVTMAATSPACTGVGCSANVTISGGLKTAPTNGATIPLPVTGTKMNGFQEANGTPHSFYQTTNQHIIHLFQSSSGGWEGYDVTANTIGQNTTNHQPASGTPLTGLANPGGHANSFYFLDGNQHIHETYDHNDNVWYDNDLTTLFGLVAAAPNSSLVAYPTSNSIDMHLHWVGTDQHIHDLHHNNVTGWSDMDVTANCISGNTTNHQPASGTPLTGLANPGGHANSFYFLDANQHIHETYDQNDEVWHDNDFMTLFGVGAAALGTPLIIYPGSGSIDMHLHYIGADGHSHDFYHNNTTGWANMDVTANSISGNTTNHQPASGTALTGLLNPGGGTTSFYFFDANQHMHETYDHNDEVWHDNDFMTLFGLSAAAQGTALISYPASGSIDMHVHYLGPNQHIYDEYHNNSTGWFNQDLNAVAALAVPDSGTVSLSVGGFTAPACFGPSTNPACNGQTSNKGPNDLAAALAQALNASNSPVTATASGATINLTWKASGPATAVSPLSTIHDSPSLFSKPSFTSATTGFSGGTAESIPVFNISYNFNVGNGDNGNVIGITNNRDTSRSQSFSYDALNRLTAAQNAGTDCSQTTLNGTTKYWGNGYGYDAWGNLLTKTATKCKAEGLNVWASANNQLHTFSGPDYTYDSAGNMLHDATFNLNYTYDQENRIIGANGYTYSYDSGGNRVAKSNGSTGTLYWYMTPGIVAESDLSGNLKSEYVFFNGGRVARRDGVNGAGSVFYYFSDHLKTTDLVTDSQGNITSESDFLPWGGELQFINNDSNHYKFASKERDTETGLDYFGARYNNSSLSRFMTPDPANAGARNIDPQSWNAYAFDRNNPVSLADPDGKRFCRPPTPAEQAQVGQGAPPLICDLTDSDYVNSSPDQQKAYDQQGYKHYDCTCDTGADKDAWRTRNGGTSPDYVGYALIFVLTFVGVEFFGTALDDDRKDDEDQPDNTPARNPNDVDRENNNPKAPDPNNGKGTIGPNQNQNAELQRDIQKAKDAGARDIRVNQEQVNADGVRVGRNRPDLQYTDSNGVRHYVEYDSDPASSAEHAQRIRSNDPNGVITPKIIK